MNTTPTNMISIARVSRKSATLASVEFPTSTLGRNAINSCLDCFQAVSSRSTAIIGSLANMTNGSRGMTPCLIFCIAQ
jgi:hypothetical protein